MKSDRDGLTNSILYRSTKLNKLYYKKFKPQSKNSSSQKKLSLGQKIFCNLRNNHYICIGQTLRHNNYAIEDFIKPTR